MKWVLKKDGKVIAISQNRFSPDYELSDIDYDVGFDGKLYSETEMQSEDYRQRKEKYDNSIELEGIRQRRENECFSIINRGGLWYDKLTTEQKNELSAWYEAWLDAPQTKVIPAKLEWLSEV